MNEVEVQVFGIQRSEGLVKSRFNVFRGMEVVPQLDKCRLTPEQHGRNLLADLGSEEELITGHPTIPNGLPDLLLVLQAQL